MAHNLKQIRQDHGLTQEKLAEEMGVAFSTINRMENRDELLQKWVKRFADYFDLPPAVIRGDAPVDAATAEIPVFGVAAGSAVGAFTMTSDVVDWAKRPPGLQAARDCYALFVAGSSMEPRYFPGEIIYVNPHRPVRARDPVVIQQRGGAQTGGIQAWLKIFERSTAEKIIARQYNPDATIDFLHSTVKAMHRVMTPNELFGV